MPPRQQSLFDAQPAAWEMDAAELRPVASVVFATNPPGPFDYEIPETLSDPAHPERLAEPGRRLRVPLGRGNRLAVGYCVDVTSKPVGSRRLKPVAGVVDGARLFSPAMLRLTRWMADYYLSTWGQVLDAVAPAAVRRQAGTREIALVALAPHAAVRLAELKLRSPRQRKVLEVLQRSGAPISVTELASRAGCTAAPIQALVKAGVLVPTRARRSTADPRRDPALGPADPGPPALGRLQLNADQQGALNSIVAALDAREPRGLLLHGVTGSGKTEVYLQAIEHVASFGRQAIVLVPEISLTPQTVRRFAARFPRVAVLHSHLTDVERAHHWQAIADGHVQVVVGARSAVFAPTPHLGLIVIDEEHETTFKQDSSPRYHARDVAWQRAQAERVPLVLGSATPSLEAWQRALAGEFDKLSLPRRVMDLPMPQVMTVDLRDPGQTRFSRGAISRPLHQAMTAALRDGGQVILLLNRRGFATHIQCPACGYVLKCEHCDLPMTFHRQHNTALCHYCDHEAAPPAACPDCRSPAIVYGGLGTQKLEMEIRTRFPEYTSARMDVDSMRARGSHDAVLSAFQRGEIRILLGTQMIAKGLDFPNVTLVGVVNADTALHLPDFRASERTFQLIAQVAGRTGRGRQGGRVLVQTLSPEHPAIAAAVRHDYETFARHELAIRQAAGYPPHSAMARLVIRGPQEAAARETAVQLGQRLRAAIAGDGAVRLLGPGAAPIARLRGEHRFHLQLHAPDAARLQALIRQAAQGFTPPEEVRWTADIDPWDMQ
ncbi:MAG TPA: primosomal protein N' [Lacipirellulaceae bacterium]|nr:primosomal protein N' [Lacipirellulaceae bacterium]